MALSAVSLIVCELHRNRENAALRQLDCERFPVSSKSHFVFVLCNVFPTLSCVVGFSLRGSSEAILNLSKKKIVKTIEFPGENPQTSLALNEFAKQSFIKATLVRVWECVVGASVYV